VIAVKGIISRGGQFATYAPINVTAFAGATAEGVWQLAAKVGVWFNQRAGEVELTFDDIATMYSNFKNGLYPKSPQQLPVDYEHLSVQKDRKPGDGKAAGWIADVDLRAEGNELWALVNWNADAKTAITNGEYKGFSPLFSGDWVTHGKKHLGVTLLGGALTNYQTIPDCVVTCSLDPRMMASVADLPYTDREERVREALTARFPPAYRDGGIDYQSYVYARWVWEDRVTFSRGGRTFEIAYHFNDDLSITFEGNEYEVTVNTTPVTALSGGIVMKVKNAQGQEVDIPAASFAALTLDNLSEIPAVKELRAKVPAEGARVVDVKTFDSLSLSVTTLDATVKALSSENEKLKTQAATSAAKAVEAEIDSVISAGKALPADKPFLIKLSNTSTELYEERMTAIKAIDKPIIKLDTEHGTGATGTTPSAIVAMENAIVEERKLDPKIDTAEAVSRISKKNITLVDAYNRAARPVFGPEATVGQ
jgi:phage I-like protein